MPRGSGSGTWEVRSDLCRGRIASHLAEMRINQARAKIAEEQANKKTAEGDPANDSKRCYHTTQAGARRKRPQEPNFIFCHQHVKKQIERGITDRQLSFPRQGRAFVLGEFVLQAAEEIHEKVHPALDVSMRREQAEMQSEKEIALRIAERKISTMNLCYVVDNGTSRDALPAKFFKRHSP